MNPGLFLVSLVLVDRLARQEYCAELMLVCKTRRLHHRRDHRSVSLSVRVLASFGGVLDRQTWLFLRGIAAYLEMEGAEQCEKKKEEVCIITGTLRGQINRGC
ncbi:hypothetical protein OIU76_013018 [Salix suchowensis]|nr:hypothetical protein OIU76_013018 [Salix suchowensis]